MIDKERFVKAINQLKEERDYVNDLQEIVYKKYNRDGEIYESPLFDTVVDVLEADMGCPVWEFSGYTLLSWWIYEMDFGRNLDADDNIETPEQLYDAIMEELAYANRE